jgi:NADPH2:quinone reductase
VDATWIGRQAVVRASTDYAERVVADVEEIMPVPDGLAIEAAAALVHDGLNFHASGTPHARAAS